MQKLTITPRGIFPIVFDKDGKQLDEMPRTGYIFPGTIQGEGKLAGVPSLFIRTSGCNLECKWLLPNGEISRCDTPESSIDIQEQEDISIEDIILTLKNNINNITHLVITGGEPCLQSEILVPLIKRIKGEMGLHITLESNGTIFIPELHGLIDLISLSPKLSTSLAGRFSQSHFDRTRKTIEQVAQLRSEKDIDFQLKCVISSPSDIEEITLLTQDIPEIKGEDILLMPLGRDAIELNQTSQLTSLLAVENGWRYCPRLHIDIWGNKPGV